MNFLITIAAALVGAAIFELLRVPAGALIGAMVAVALVNVSSLPVAELPTSAQFLTFASIGWLIGQGMTGDVLRSLASSAGLIGGTVLLLLLLGGAVAAMLVKFGYMDPATAFLSTSPGGLSQMSALSTAVGADSTLVATVHVLRVVAVVGLAPLILKLLPDSG
jgi:membrane AbrB-like protein